MSSRLSMIAAMDRGRVIGAGNALPWRIPEDLRRFRRLTLGHPVIMGRRTHESIGRALDGRLNVVLTRAGGPWPGCRVAADLDAALDIAAGAAGAGEIFVIGGARVYAAALARADRLYLTLLDAEFDGDARFPAFDLADWEAVDAADFPATGERPFAYRNVTLDRRRPGTAR